MFECRSFDCGLVFPSITSPFIDYLDVPMRVSWNFCYWWLSKVVVSHWHFNVIDQWQGWCKFLCALILVILVYWSTDDVMRLRQIGSCSLFKFRFLCVIVACCLYHKILWLNRSRISSVTEFLGFILSSPMHWSTFDDF